MITEAFRHLLRNTHQGKPEDAPAKNKAGILDVKALVEAPLPAPNKLKYEKHVCSDMWV
jgi:hypothetical protein